VGTPVYRVKSESGPGHRKRFLVEVRLKLEGEPGKPLARGIGTTKKRAEQDAARRALERMSSGTAVELNKDGTGGVSEEEDSL
jgi:ribonuclease-3